MSRQVVVPVVIDTNILVPSLYSRTYLFDFVLKGNLVLIWNSFIYNEAVEIIVRLGPIYKKKADVDSYDVVNLLQIVFDENDKVGEMPTDWPPASPDRDDDPFLFAAETGRAEYIISADCRHMLKLQTFKEIPIGTPSDFFSWAKKHRPLKDVK